MRTENALPLRRHLGWALPLLALLWWKVLDFPQRTARPQLDESWHAVKGWELLHHPRLGVESVFTYGPLGWFHSSCYVPELFWWKVLFWECGVKLALCWLCVLAVVRARGWLQRLFFGLALAWAGSGMDAFAYISLVAILSWVLAEEQRSARTEIPVLLAGALVAEVKFTYCTVYGLGIVLAVAGLWLASGRARALQVLWRAAGTFALSWIVAGQSLLDLPRYVQTSWWIASGYNDGMSLPGAESETTLALWMVAASVLPVAIELWRGPRSGRHLALGLFVLLGVWVSYKSGFTRHMGNSSLFFGSAPVLTWFVLARPARAGRLDLGLGIGQRAVQAGLLLAGTSGFVQSLGNPELPLSHYFLFQRVLLQPKPVLLTHLGKLRESLELDAARTRAAFALPHIGKRVGRESVDVFGASQAIAMLNDFEYRPRPVFQGYSVYTPELLALNRAFYEGPRAPRFVLYRQDGIDGRLSIHDDSQALEALLLRYEPVFSEQGYLLLERADAPRDPGASELVLEKDISLGEWIDLAELPGKVLQLQLDVKRRLRGELRAFVQGGPVLYATLEHPNGTSLQVRIVPRIVGTGMLVRPEIESQDEAVRLFCGEAPPGLRRLRFEAAEGENTLWKSRMHLRVLRRDGLLPPPRPAIMAGARYSMFDPTPERVTCAHPFTSVDVDGRTFGLCHAPSTLVWSVDPGRFALETSFGILDSAWSGTNCTDGAYFQVLLVPDGGKPQTLFERRLDPAKVPLDRGVQSTRVEFDTDAHARVALRIGPGPKGNSACDWTYWGGFTLRRE